VGMARQQQRAQTNGPAPVQAGATGGAS
jgi:hypothetical protein